MTDAVTGQKIGAPGASVTLTIKEPKDGTSAVTGTTDSSGNFVYKFKPGQKDPIGAWQVEAVATKDSVTGINTAIFTVQ
jgi:hypothetical protein